MAATIARATGNDKSRSKEAHRLGSESAVVEAATWATSARASVNRNGEGVLALSHLRTGQPIVFVDFQSEDHDDVTRLVGVQLAGMGDILAKLRAVHAALYADGPDTSWSPDTLDAIAEAIGGYEGVTR